MGVVTESVQSAAGQPPAAKAWVPEFDVLRGVAIVFVVYMHAWFGAWPGVPRHELLIVNALVLLGHSAVPVDFFLSGYLLGRDRSPSLGNFVRRKARRIGIPVAFGTVLIVLYRLWQAGGIDPTLWRDVALFNVTGPYYYILILVVFMAGAWVIRGWPVQRLGFVAAASFVVTLAAVAWYQHAGLGPDGGLYAYRNPAVWLFYGAFGFYASRRWDSLDWTRRWLAPGLAVMACAAAVYFVEGEVFGAYPAGVFGVSIFAFDCAAIVVYPALVQLIAGSRAGEWLLLPSRRLARFAFAIYLLHMPFFTGYLTSRTVSAGDVGGDYLELIVAIFAVGFAACVATVVLLDRTLPRVTGLLLGTEPQRRGTRTGHRSQGQPRAQLGTPRGTLEPATAKRPQA